MKHWTAKYVLSVLDQKDWSMNRLAEEIGVAATTVNRPMRADEPLSAKTISKIFQKTGIDPAPFAPDGLEEPISVYKSGPMGKQPKSRAHRVLETLDDPQPQVPVAFGIKIALDGRYAQIVATVDKDGLRQLIEKLEGIEKIIDG